MSDTGPQGKADSMGIDALLGARREQVLRLAAKHGARNVRIFGSAARGEADATSDLDFLIELEPGRNALDMGGLLMDLQSLLGRPVDVISEKGLRPSIRARVLREAVPL
jgi:predicted nucleotidyltransferase